MPVMYLSTRDRDSVSKRRCLHSGMDCLKMGLAARACNLSYSGPWTVKASLGSSEKLQSHACQFSETLSQHEKGGRM